MNTKNKILPFIVVLLSVLLINGIETFPKSATPINIEKIDLIV